MRIKRQIWKFVERITNTHIYRIVPRGIDFGADIRSSMPRARVNIIFDVGANIGQAARQFLRQFPEAQIICFEPVERTFADLHSAFSDEDRVRCVRVALGATCGTGSMVHSGTPDLYYLSRPGMSNESDVGVRSEAVETTTLDAFCAAAGYERVDLLKIDTEGGDLEVLRGGHELLSRKRVGLIEVEAGVSPHNRLHVPLDDIRGYLEGLGYLLFGFYEQTPEWPSGHPNLRRVNAVFVSDVWAAENCIGPGQTKPTPFYQKLE